MSVICLIVNTDIITVYDITICYIMFFLGNTFISARGLIVHTYFENGSTCIINICDSTIRKFTIFIG